MLGQEILMEIDATLDQLIQNAEVLQKADLSQLSEPEIEGFQKTQESLLHHLLHMDQMLQLKRENLKVPQKGSAASRIQEKRVKFERLKSAYYKSLSQTCKLPILSKRKEKRFFSHLKSV